MILGGIRIHDLVADRICYYVWRKKVSLCNQEYHRKFRKGTYSDFLICHIVPVSGRFPINSRIFFFDLVSRVNIIHNFITKSQDKYFTNIELPENYVYSKTNIKADIFWINDGKVTKYYHKVLDKM